MYNLFKNSFFYVIIFLISILYFTNYKNIGLYSWDDYWYVLEARSINDFLNYNFLPAAEKTGGVLNYIQGVTQESCKPLLNIIQGITFFVFGYNYEHLILVNIISFFIIPILFVIILKKNKILFKEKYLILILFLSSPLIYFFARSTGAESLTLVSLLISSYYFFLIIPEKKILYTIICGILLCIAALINFRNLLAFFPLSFFYFIHYYYTKKTKFNFLLKKFFLIWAIFLISIFLYESALQIIEYKLNVDIVTYFDAFKIRVNAVFSNKKLSNNVHVGFYSLQIVKLYLRFSSWVWLILTFIGSLYSYKFYKRERSHIIIVWSQVTLIPLLLFWSINAPRSRALVSTIPFLSILCVYGLYKLLRNIKYKNLIIYSIILFTVILNMKKISELLNMKIYSTTMSKKYITDDLNILTNYEVLVRNFTKRENVFYMSNLNLKNKDLIKYITNNNINCIIFSKYNSVKQHNIDLNKFYIKFIDWFLKKYSNLIIEKKIIYDDIPKFLLKDDITDKRIDKIKPVYYFIKFRNLD